MKTIIVYWIIATYYNPKVSGEEIYRFRKKGC